MRLLTAKTAIPKGVPQELDEEIAWLTGDAWDAQERLWAQDDLISFIRRLSPAYRPAWFHFKIADALRRVATGECKRLMIVMPPRHGKSTLASRYFPAWFLGLNPDSRIIATSYASRLAERFSRFSRNVVSDPKYPFDVSLAKDSRSADVWDLHAHAGGYISAGVGGSITGEGANVLLIDDPVKGAKESDSPTTRENTIEWFQETAYPRLEAGGAIVMIGTRWRDDDLLGFVLKQQEQGGDRWEVLHFPAVNHQGEALWPEKYPIPELMLRKNNMTSRSWAAQYQGNPIPDEGGTFKQWWWSFWHYPGQPLPPVTVKGPSGASIQKAPVSLPTRWDGQSQSWDMSFKETDDGSYVVGQVWGSHGAGRWLLDQYRARVDFTQTVLAVRALTARWPTTRAKYIENKANGPAVISTLRREIPGIIEVEPEGSKEARANAMSYFVEAGNVYLPHPMIAPWVTTFIEECARFPLGENDDQVDALTQALLKTNTSAVGRTRSTSYTGNGMGREADEEAKWGGVTRYG